MFTEISEINEHTISLIHKFIKFLIIIDVLVFKINLLI